MFGEGIELSDISWIRTGNDLRLTIAGEGGGTVTIDDHFFSSDYSVEVIELADGTVLDQDQIAIDVRTLRGTDGNNTLTGTSTDEILIGEGGTDTLNGSGGADELFGGSGSDRLYGGTGSDNLYGGTGTDRLEGDAGNDVYHWGRGDGNDTIHDYDSADRNDASHQDKLLFGEGIELNDLSGSQLGNNLVFTLEDTNETLTINNYFISDDYKVEQVELADGTSLSINQSEEGVDLLIQSMASIPDSSSDGINPQSVQAEDPAATITAPQI